MDIKLWDWMKEHPYATGGIVLCGALGVYLVFQLQMANANAQSASASTATNSTGMDDAQYEAYTQAQTALAQTSAAATAQTSQQNYQLAVDQLTAQNNEDLTNLQGQYALDEATTSAAVTNNANNDQTTVAMQQLSDQLAGLVNTNQTAIDTATITANEQEDLANTNAAALINQATITAGVLNTEANDQTQVALTQSNNNTALGITQANDNTAALETVANDQESSNTVGSIFGFLGKIL